MLETELFPVCCTAEVPSSVVDRFLDDAHAGSERLVPDSPRILALLTTDSAGAALAPDTASLPPVQPFVSPFVGQPIQYVSQLVAGISYFVVLDERSVNEDTAVLAACQSDGTVKTVRVTFDSAQHLLTALDVATIGFAEIQSIADSSGGVYGLFYDPPMQGGPAPRKMLGA